MKNSHLPENISSFPLKCPYLAGAQLNIFQTFLSLFIFVGGIKFAPIFSGFFIKTLPYQILCFYLLTRGARFASVCKGSWLSMALGLAMMVLDVQKNLKPTQFYLLNNLCYKHFAQKSSTGGVLACGRLLAVHGPGLGPDGPGCPEKP